MDENITGTNKERYDKTIRRREKFAVYFFDMSKISFTTMVLANLGFLNEKQTIYNGFILIFGLLMTIFFAWIGNRIMKF